MSSSKDLMGAVVYRQLRSTTQEPRYKKLGRIHQLVFHPTKKYLLGYLVKRPDFILMFRRSDVFVSYDELTPLSSKGLVKQSFVLAPDAEPASLSAASKKLDLDLEHSIVWLGLPVVDDQENSYGSVAEISWDSQSGKVSSITTSQGVQSDILLGSQCIPEKLIKGFKMGCGAELAWVGDTRSRSDMTGALLVDAQVLQLDAQGGLAQRAGQAYYTHVVPTAKKKAKELGEQGTKAVICADEAVQKAAFETGRVLGKTKGMFATFKAEYDKAKQED